MKIFRTIPLSLTFLVIIALVFVGCDKEINSKNMEQIYAEQGIPVKTKIIEKSTFSKGLEYNAVISGVKESSAFTRIPAKVETILYKIGDYVKKDAIVLTFPNDNPKAQYYQSKLAFENAISTFERMKNFYETGGLSRQDFENAETSFKIAEANWNSIKQSIKVKAPISGVITRFNVKVSENVEKDDELFTVAQIDNVKARLWVSDREINKIQNEQKVIAEWNKVQIEGKVVQVDLSMNQMKKAFAVDLVFDNAQNQMRTGVTAKITIETYVSENSIFIERKNIIKEDTNQFVFINNNGKAKKRIIETGITSGIDVEVLSGLNPGDELVVEGQMLLEDNKKINLITD